MERGGLRQLAWALAIVGAFLSIPAADATEGGLWEVASCQNIDVIGPDPACPYGMSVSTEAAGMAAMIAWCNSVPEYAGKNGLPCTANNAFPSNGVITPNNGNPYYSRSDSGSGPPGGFSFSWRWYINDNDPEDCPSGQIEPQGYDCVPPPDCTGDITGQAFLRPVGSADNKGNICHESSQCLMTVNSLTELASGAGMVEYTGTNQECTTEPEEMVTSQNELENCISSGGDIFCTEPDLADENCGMLNGEYICLDSIPDGNCTFYGDGGMACSPTAGSPPAPDDGVTSGTPANPDNTVSTDGNTVNIYNNSTVNNSLGDTSGTEQGENPELTIEIDFSQIIEDEPPSDSFVGDINDDITETGNALQSVEDELADPNDFGLSTTAGNEWTSIFGYTYSCSDIVLAVPTGNVTVECAELSDLRAVLGWIARVIFFIAIFNLILRRPE